MFDVSTFGSGAWWAVRHSTPWFALGLLAASVLAAVLGLVPGWASAVGAAIASLRLGWSAHIGSLIAAKREEDAQYAQRRLAYRHAAVGCDIVYRKDDGSFIDRRGNFYCLACKDGNAIWVAMSRDGADVLWGCSVCRKVVRMDHSTDERIAVDEHFRALLKSWNPSKETDPPNLKRDYVSP